MQEGELFSGVYFKQGEEKEDLACSVSSLGQSLSFKKRTKTSVLHSKTPQKAK
jgi:hypothetical protein